MNHGTPVDLELFSFMKINPESQKNMPGVMVTVIVARNHCLWVPIILGPVTPSGSTLEVV
jgi:hypothetical protein